MSNFDNFRLSYLKLQDHPQLGTIDLRFSEFNDVRFTDELYTTVIIGANGTGKSYILKTIADIFRNFEELKITGIKKFSFPYSFEIGYFIGDNLYEIITRKFALASSNRINRPLREYSYRRRKAHATDINNTDGKYLNSISDLELPQRLLVNSIMANDRFVFKKSERNHFYQYLGVRSTNSTMSTKSSTKKAIRHIFNATDNNKNFIKNLNELLKFLEFEQLFKIVYDTRITKLFFSQKNVLTVELFKKYFENWWEDDFPYTKRKEENPSWSLPYYNKYFKNNPKLTEELVLYLNNLSHDSSKLFRKPSSSSRLIILDLFDNKVSSDLDMLMHLENLDIISLQGITLRKEQSDLSIDQISSGEYHIFVSLIGVLAKIEPGSIVLIDEPEISLHPNWQMKYLSFLKKVFKNYPHCHFILTTHSHFLISDLKGESSYIIGLTRANNKLEPIEFRKNLDTYGWSAEEVLYKVFNVRTTRNFYLEEELRELLHKIATKSNKTARMKELLDSIRKVKLSKNDPMNLIIKKAEEYLKND